MTTYAIIKEILENNLEARNSDDLLYVEFIKRTQPELLHKSFQDIILNRKLYNLLSFKTVIRVRQKIQELYPKLQSSDKVKDMRDYQKTGYKYIYDTDWDRVESFFKNRSE